MLTLVPLLGQPRYSVMGLCLESNTKNIVYMLLGISCCLNPPVTLTSFHRLLEGLFVMNHFVNECSSHSSITLISEYNCNIKNKKMLELIHNE